MKTAKIAPTGIRLLLLLGLLLLGKEMGALAGTGTRHQAEEHPNVIVKSCSMMLKVSGEMANAADRKQE